MPLFHLNNERLALTVSSHGGTILNLEAKTPQGSVHLLRPAKINEQTNALQSGCFPLVPFANRIANNQFDFNGKHYQLKANTDWDRHYLHGDAWLNEWSCPERSSQLLILEYQHSHGIYQYHTRQRFVLNDTSLDVTLEVTNIGPDPMPFGLGWHPYFPLTEHTTVQADASGYWLEKSEWLAGDYCSELPAEFNFNQPNLLPRKWVNNGFNGWSGGAIIRWPEHHIQLTMATSPPCPVYFIFISDPKFDAGYDFDFFCLEPMSHAANAHNASDSGGLKSLRPKESMSLTMTLEATLIE